MKILTEIVKNNTNYTYYITYYSIIIITANHIIVIPFINEDFNTKHDVQRLSFRFKPFINIESDESDTHTINFSAKNKNDNLITIIKYYRTETINVVNLKKFYPNKIINNITKLSLLDGNILINASNVHTNSKYLIVLLDKNSISSWDDYFIKHINSIQKIYWEGITVILDDHDRTVIKSNNFSWINMYFLNKHYIIELI